MFFSEKFRIEGSQFRIKVSTTNQSFVGIYLHNMNNWAIKCSLTIKAGSREFNSGTTFIKSQGEAGHNWGVYDFFSEEKCSKFLEVDGSLKVEVSVQLLEENAQARMQELKVLPPINYPESQKASWVRVM